jgi:AraC-like DNA-binding protein
VQQAKSLRVESRLSIKEVAGHCGYQHVSQFDRQFRRLSGLTPGRYRSLWQVRPAGRSAVLR